MKELSRNEMAAVKRINSTTKKLNEKRDKLYNKIKDLQKQCMMINDEIALWEAPIRQMTGGFTSTEVLDGTWLLPLGEPVAANNIEPMEYEEVIPEDWMEVQ